MKLENYRVAAEQTDIESFNDGADAVVIEWDGESKVIQTFTSGTRGYLYEGESMEDARESLQLSQDEWDALLSSPVTYLERI